MSKKDPLRQKTTKNDKNELNDQNEQNDINDQNIPEMMSNDQK